MSSINLNEVNESKAPNRRRVPLLDEILDILQQNDRRQWSSTDKDFTESSANKFDKKPKKYRKLTKQHCLFLIRRATEIFQAEQTLLQVSLPITICGDTHGQFSDVLEIMDSVGWPPEQRYLFLGDYVDRGEQSIELICLMYLLKICYPEHMYLLRGNHETAEVNSTHGFKDDCLKYFDLSVWNAFQESFRYLPLSALVGENIFCAHGGISEHILKIDDIAKLPRPLDIPQFGIACDLVWSDPTPEELHDGNCGYCFNRSRSTSCWYCSDAVEEFLRNNSLELIVRAHEMVDFGFSFTNDRKVLTVFTAPHYCGYQNDAGILYVDENMHCQIRTFQFIKHAGDAETQSHVPEENTKREKLQT